MQSASTIFKRGAFKLPPTRLDLSLFTGANASGVFSASCPQDRGCEADFRGLTLLSVRQATIHSDAPSNPIAITLRGRRSAFLRELGSVIAKR
jgi:hypothetical protein